MLMSKEYSPLHTITPNANIVLMLLFVIRHNSQNCGSGNVAKGYKRTKECKVCSERFEVHKKSNKCKSCGGQLRIVVDNRNIRKLGDI